MQKIMINAGDVWDYFHNNKASLINREHTIAENTDFGVVISLSSENDLPCFVVTADNYQYAEERAGLPTECKEVAIRLYNHYLTGEFINDESGDDSEEDSGLLSPEDMIEERELELDSAISTLLDVVLEEDAAEFLGRELDKVVDDLKDHIFEYLYRKHGLSTRRPMFLEDEETHEDFFEEYPYDSMVFDDEDNPIYKE